MDSSTDYGHLVQNTSKHLERNLMFLAGTDLPALETEIPGTHGTSTALALCAPQTGRVPHRSSCVAATRRKEVTPAMNRHLRFWRAYLSTRTMLCSEVQFDRASIKVKCSEAGMS